MTPELKQKQDHLEAIRIRLAELCHQVKEDFREAETRAADYEEAKSQYLIELFAEENDAEKKVKRTEPLRTAMYRAKFADLRLARGLSKANAEATKKEIDLLLGQQSNLQSQIKLEQGEN